jgi:hypothetical protein
MRIEFTVDELKELIEIKTSSAGTPDVNERIKNAVNQLLRIEGKEQLS